MNKLLIARSRKFNATFTSQKDLLIACAFLLSLVLLSVTTYISHLGFYSDDWGFLTLLKNSPDQSFSGLFRSLMSDHNIRVRPVQVFTLVVLYQLFDLSPLGYHAFNTLLLVSIAFSLLFLLRELRRPLWLSTAVPAVYLLLPHYSTDRFWIAAVQANVSMVFYFLGFYAALRSLRSGWLWLIIGVLSTFVSVLAYEVAVPLFLLTIVGVLWKGKLGVRATCVSAAVAGSVFACFLFKIAINQRPVMASGTFGSHAVWLLKQSLFVNFFQLGFAYPRVVYKVLRYHSKIDTLIVSVGIGLLVFFYIRWSLRRQGELLSQTSWKAMIAAGLVIFGLGYAVFLSTDQVSFNKTGMANRVSIAATLGIAFCFLGLIGWISAISAPRFRNILFSLGVSTLCASGALVINATANYWTSGYAEEQSVIHKFENHHLSLQPENVFFIDGVCPYDGPVPILESWWEVSGIAQLVFHQPKLRGDVISPRVHINPTRLTTSIYAETKSYAYRDKLVLYNAALDRVFVFHSMTEMNGYLQQYGKFSNFDKSCPGYPGEGAPVF